jgi:hypothetical protein
MTITLEVDRLTGRKARCACGYELLSNEAQECYGAFFEFTGVGSHDALRCAGIGLNKCGRYDFVHGFEARDPEGRKISCPVLDHDFVPREPSETDRFYCGHNGWD